MAEIKANATLENINEDLLKGLQGLEIENDGQEYVEMPIPLDLKGIVNQEDEDIVGLVNYDKKEFIRGVNDFSYLAGGFTALRNAGVSSSEALTLIQLQLEVKSVKHQLKTQEKIAEITINNQDKLEV